MPTAQNNEMKLAITILFFCGMLNVSTAQDRNSIWIFGDSAGVDFTNVTNPVSVNSTNESRGSCTSISDSSGNLLFYAYTPHVSLWLSGYLKIGVLKNNIQGIMVNGDSLIGDGWYHEMVILPFPGSDSLFYLFSIGVTLNYGLYYSIIDMSLDSGHGVVVQKDVQLQNFPMADCLSAVKHANGRDWWLIFRKWDPVNYDPYDNFYFYLITPSGIGNFNQQNIGSLSYSGGGSISFSKDANRFVFTNWSDLVEIYDFDRCSGLITGFQNVEPGDTMPPYKLAWSSAFSPDESKLYVSTSGGTGGDTSYLFQYDLNAANIQASRISLDTLYHPVLGGALKLGPDDKIYFSCAWDCPGIFCYPYPDTVYNPVNMNLSVINEPDSLGAACGYAPFSFYLGGKRTYYGLPNNPDYELGPLVGSPCDTLGVGIWNTEQGILNSELFVYYNSSWEKLFINAQGLKGKHYVLQLYNLLGGVVYKEESSLQPPYFFRELDTGKFAQGLYIVSFITEKEKLVKKFVK